MKVEANKKYVCENLAIVELEKSSLPYYKFKAKSIDWTGKLESCSEVWTEDGVAYHNDCGYNIICEFKE